MKNVKPALDIAEQFTRIIHRWVWIIILIDQNQAAFNFPLA
ncbi:hypothetical protein [Pseudomonas asiatica]|nr:hypothetical protein [Pseudomonas asiatica]